MNHYSQSLSEEQLYKDEEKKISEGDEINKLSFREFYDLIDNLKKANPTYRPQDFKKLMKEDEYKDDYDDVVFAFLDDFGDLTMDNEYYRDVVIALSTIGIEIPKPRTKNNSVNEDIEEENNNVVDNKNELLPEIPVLSRQDTAFEAKV